MLWLLVLCWPETSGLWEWFFICVSVFCEVSWAFSLTFVHFAQFRWVCFSFILLYLIWLLIIRFMGFFPNERVKGNRFGWEENKEEMGGGEGGEIYWMYRSIKLFFNKNKSSFFNGGWYTLICVYNVKYLECSWTLHQLREVSEKGSPVHHTWIYLLISSTRFGLYQLALSPTDASWIQSPPLTSAFIYQYHQF